MFLIDTHSHIYQPAFDDDRHEMMRRAAENGVRQIYLPNITLESIPAMHQLCDDYPGICFPMMGLHPCDVKEDFAEVLSKMHTYFSQRNYIAVGETGIDLYWDKSTLHWQQEAFRIQINWAKDLSIPIVIHARESFNEIFDILDEMNDDRLTGVLHCFTGDSNQAKKIMDYGGFVMGIGGVLTYEKSGLAEVIKDVPMEYLILETDSPYLTPKPFRGKRNESAYVRFVAEKLAAVKGIAPDEVAARTSENARRVFKLDSAPMF